MNQTFQTTSSPFDVGNSETDTPRVTFGIVNCNRLHYLRSCVESLVLCTQDYKNKEIIIVDNASVEEGTEQYLKEKELQGLTIFRQKKRDPSNEFAMALNLICEKSTGDFVCPLQGDLQFTLSSGWLTDYVKFYEKYKPAIGCIMLDAQRRITHAGHSPFGVIDGEDSKKFLFDTKRSPVCAAGDVMFSRDVIDKIYPWETVNENHEGGLDSETKMLKKVHGILSDDSKTKWFTVVPMMPPAVAIYTDARGTNARVRKNKRYGDYWPAKVNDFYYHVWNREDLLGLWDEEDGRPLPIEVVAKPLGWPAPIDEHGNWMKNPIRPETASDDDYVILYEGEDQE